MTKQLENYLFQPKINPQSFKSTKTVFKAFEGKPLLGTLQLTQNKSLKKKLKDAASDKINSHCTSTGTETSTVKSVYSHYIDPSFDILRTARDKQKVYLLREYITDATI